ncbi:TerC family protein [Lysinibacillus sp. 54212]|uniref:TerC family protein n=1 Tax=Lysinibacillus sp. 54212 TaxID=3119829 RepID=UPI002FCBE886
MEFLSMDFLTAILSIVLIDLVLAGDNALLIGLAAKNVPKRLQKKVILAGTFGAIIIRTLLTLVAVKLLEIDGLMLIGGVLLIYISFKLLLSAVETDINPSKNTFWGALWTILLADILMGVDNVLGVAGAAEGNYVLVVCGLLISIPIVVWGSTVVIHLMERFPIIIVIGAGVLVWTGSKMIIKDTYVAPFFNYQHEVIVFQILLVGFVLSLGLIYKTIKKGRSAASIQ